MKIIEKGFDRYAEIKVTTTTYCQSCSRDFEDLEIVFFAWLDNTIICRKCTEAHAEVEPRLYAREGASL